jgi:hypothetical protein
VTSTLNAPYRPSGDDYLAADAVISEDGLYRYVLTRRWGPGPVMPWTGLNPSTADASTDDQTIRQMCWFAQREGCGGICVLNLYALRSPSPEILRKCAGEPGYAIGPDNDEHLAGLAGNGTGIPVTVAWGAHPLAAARVPRVLELLAGIPLACLGTTASGAPRHPCRLGHDTPLVPYRVPS